MAPGPDLERARSRARLSSIAASSLAVSLPDQSHFSIWGHATSMLLPRNAHLRQPSRYQGAPDALEDPAMRPSTDLGRLLVSARRGWRTGKRPWLAVVLSVMTVLVSVFLHNPDLGHSMWRWGDVYASLPLGTELSRIPMSFLLPTPYLPIWGAAAQVLVVIGIGEMVLGRWLVVWVAVVGHVCATLTTRLVIEFGQGTAFALHPELARALDTGPSAAVTAVGACLLVSLRLHRLVFLLCGALIVSAIVAPGIDGQEHLVALACGLAFGVMDRYRHRQPQRPPVDVRLIAAPSSAPAESAPQRRPRRCRVTTRPGEAAVASSTARAKPSCDQGQGVPCR